MKKSLMLGLGVCLATTTMGRMAMAGDGVGEINQVCATQTGCFPSDAPGFPVRIPASGSYRLTSNLEVTTNGRTAIDVTVPSVEIDLNGFQIKGPVVCSDTGTTISCTPDPTSGAGVHALGNPKVSVRNGIVRGFNNGLNLASDAVVEDMIIYGNADRGIVGGRMMVRDVIVSLNSGNGIDVDRTSQIVGSVAAKNRSAGLRGRAGATRMEKNLVVGNYGAGLFCNTGCNIRRNAVIDNGDYGIWTGVSGAGNWIEGNLISNNAGRAINTGSQTGFRHNVIQWDLGTASGVTGGVYVHPNLCQGGQSDAGCRVGP